MTLRLTLIALALLGQLCRGAEPKAFVHPGLLHTQADLDRMKAMVAQGAEPWTGGFKRLQEHAASQADWRLQGPHRVVSRGANQSLHIREMDQDANAAYQNAIMWCVAGREEHAKKAAQILNAWSADLKEIAGDDKILGASLGGFKFVNAAEILRSTYPGWPAGDQERCRRMLKTVFCPVIQDFAAFANGNWDAGCIKTLMGIGVFCDDRAIFDRAVRYYRQGSGNGCLTHYVVDDRGQCQESGRDQQHTQLGLAHLAEACEIAWNQGLDLYAAEDNRLLKGFEYTARYNLGQDVPFTPFVDVTGKYKAKQIASEGRGTLRPIYEMVWNHYQNRRAVEAPYTRRAAESIRPEGAAHGADHPGFGTLLFSREPASAPLQAEEGVFLSDPSLAAQRKHQQQWGVLGLDVAAARPGATGAALQIGQRKFDKGLGHHANGEIVVNLQGQYQAFHAWLGVQWQGGKRGSVIFRVLVDGKVALETGPMSDGAPAKRVELPLSGARELRLAANDAGDGIGCDMANWADARLVRDPRAPVFGACSVELDNTPAPRSSVAAGGFSLFARDRGPQVAVMEPIRAWTASTQRGEEVRARIPVSNVVAPLRVVAEVAVVHGTQAEIELAIGANKVVRRVAKGSPSTVSVESTAEGGTTEIVATTRGLDAEAGVRWSGLRRLQGRSECEIPLAWPSPNETLPPPSLPSLRPSVEQELIQWDWRMQDGIGVASQPQSWKEATGVLLDRGDKLMRNLAAAGALSAGSARQWNALRADHGRLLAAGATPDLDWEGLWRRAHRLRRKIALENPLANVGPILFVKHVPSSFSHQLTQYSGKCARPGGGLFVLDAPGESMRCRRLGDLPEGSCLRPDVSWDGRRILLAFCKTDPQASDWRTSVTQFYHLFEMAADGSSPRQLTDGAYDDFSPCYLPDGRILFLSTRRGGFHRCGRGPCPVYTMAVANADGSGLRVVSFHETHEWDPAVLHDGRVVYTRWDYVDRSAVYYQQLWTARTDGSDVRAFYGNNTWNPVGVWEARPVPGSNRIMATAAAHHAMTAGSIILVDCTKGIDGLEPIARLTSDALFPESEFPVGPWHAPAGVPSPPEVPVEERRWPGHCYRSPYPLSDDFFLAAYSFEPLVGEPHANAANMFGLYLVDRFGNKELLYRDVNIGSLWPIPLRARPRPPALPSLLAETETREGTFFVQNVYASWPKLAREGEPVRQLRILQVLPKTTPNANSPRVGLASASPGKQVLGTVPVEADGSAYFRAPAGVPLSFQALDARGMAVQTMRSITYLQPGEHASCVGCHERRTTTPGAPVAAMAMRREPSAIEPGPAGSKPFNYAILVQPVLDKHCVRCHCPADAQGGIDLTGVPAGEFTVSYNALARRVPYSEWKHTPQANFEPLTFPDRFGARASPLMALLLKGHAEVKLPEEDLRRLATWMDANALFYGTFDREDQERQRRGQLIAGPALE